MSKYTIVVIFLCFIIYTGIGLFVEIPSFANNIIYGLLSAATLYFLIFHFEIGSDIKKRFNENQRNYNEKKELKNP